MLIFDGRNPYISEGKNFTFRRVSGKDAYYNLRSALSSRMEVIEIRIRVIFWLREINGRIGSVLPCIFSYREDTTGRKTAPIGPKTAHKGYNNTRNKVKAVFFSFSNKIFFLSN